MGNPFFSRFSNAPTNLPGPFQNAAYLASQFKQFRDSFQGDPRQQVQELLDSGKMSQERFNYFSNMVSPFERIINSLRM